MSFLSFLSYCSSPFHSDTYLWNLSSSSWIKGCSEKSKETFLSFCCFIFCCRCRVFFKVIIVLEFLAGQIGSQAFRVRMKSLNATTSTESKKPTEQNIRQAQVVSVQKSCSSPKSLSFSLSLICNEGNHSNKTLIIELHFGNCCQH